MRTALGQRAYVAAAVDGSAESVAAARFAVGEAHLRGLAVLLVHAYPLESGRDAQEGRTLFDSATRAENVLNSTVAQLRVPAGLEISTRLFHGRAEDLLGAVGAESVLLVLGHQTPDQGGDELAPDGLSSHVLTQGSCPVVVVPEGWRPQPVGLPVMVAVDDADRADAALSVAFEEASLRRLDLTVLHVLEHEVDPRQMEEDPAMAATLQRWRAAYPDVRVRTVSEVGDPATVLHGTRIHAAVLVLGSPHVPWPTWSRSIVRRVLESHGCPTIVVGDDQVAAAGRALSR